MMTVTQLISHIRWHEELQQTATHSRLTSISACDFVSYL